MHILCVMKNYTISSLMKNNSRLIDYAWKASLNKLIAELSKIK